MHGIVKSDGIVKTCNMDISPCRPMVSTRDAEIRWYRHLTVQTDGIVKETEVRWYRNLTVKRPLVS